jgi:hypothetical protein
MGTSIFKHKTTGFGGTIASFYPSTTFRFSQVSNAYLFEATLLENRNPLGGPSYLFHGYARDGINGPLTFEYRPSDFKRVVTRHTGDPQVSEMVPLLFLGTRPEAPSSISMASCHFADPPLTAPFEEEAYYIPHPYPEFGVGFINKEIYSKPTSPCNLQGSNMFYTTPYLVARDQIQLDAFLWGEMNVPVFSTASDLLPSGIGPDSWFGRFQNTPNLIQFEPALGSFHRFFLGQVRDFRPYNQLPYELFKDGSLIQSGSLTNHWISIGNPGTYTLRIPFSNYFISGQGGSAVMEAGFDTQKLDPNPPYLTQFNIMEDGDVTDTVVAGSGQAALEVLDDKGIFQVDLIYSAGNGWRNLTVTNTGPGTYVANLPSFVADTFVSLRLLAADASGNSLSYEMNPAFFAKVETLSIPSKPNGPSSGDTETTYSYSTGGTLSQLGHKVQYLFDWGDGTNSGWLPVGTTTASKSWTDARTYSVTVQARCIKHTSSLSPWSEVLSVTINLPDTTPPAPNPMDWETPPFRTGTTSISMVATTATDPTTPILYYFDFVDSPSGGTGGNDSDWQSGTPYTNAGLQVNHQYGYRVKARDGANNETSYSTPIRYAYTAIEPPTGITFGTIAPTSIELQSTHTPSGLTRAASGLIIENTTHGTNSGWKQNNELWTSHSLSPNTLYSFRAKARNGDAIETGYCPSASRLTLANQPGTASFSNITQTCIRVNWTPNGNPDGTQYFCENTSMGTNSGWITETFWDSCGLVCGTSYSFRVKSRNRDGIESGWTSPGIQMTFVCEAITKPNLPSGPMKGATGIDYVYSTEGSKSNYGHSVQYLFDWGDGTNSGWLSIGTVSASKSWAAAGTFGVSVQARCVDHLSVISPWSESLTVKISIPVTVSLTSIGADDGRIRESHKGSGVGGSVSSSVLYVGDDSKDQQYKSILSFDTSGISPDAVILSATLKLKRRIHSGTNPFTTHGPCHVDVAKGTFGARTLQASDFQAFATASRVATLSNPAVDGAISIANLNASGLEALNKGGLTQMRIYFSMPYTDDNNSDYIGFYSGETNNPLANRPVLEVIYF